MRLSKNELLFLALLFLITIGASYLLYTDFNRRLDVGENRVVGTLVIKRNRAERKYTRQVVWEGLENSVPLYNRDSIRTGNLSDAVIKLLDGTEISVEENSMIVLNISESKALDINFEYGAVQASKSSKDGTAVNIKKGDKTISISDSEVSLSGAQGEEGLNLVVKRGEATLDAGGKQQKLGENETASMKGDEVSVEKLALLPLTPPDGSRIFTEEEKSSVPFSWKSEASGARLEVAPSRTFSRGVIRKTIPSSETTLSLGKGNYYWRISATNPETGKKETSAISRFSVLKKTPLSLYSPQSGASVFTAETESFVNFVWSENQMASGYILEISQQPDFSTIQESINSITTSVATKLVAGSYYWRVRTKSQIPEAIVQSSPGNFSISQRQEIPVPQPVRPANGRTISSTLIQEQGLNFQWISDASVRSVEFQLADNPGFNGQPLASGLSGSGFYTLKTEIKTGPYYWRVRSMGKNGQASAYSNVVAFTVAETGQIRLLNPAAGELLGGEGITNRGVRMVWEKLPSPGTYSISVSRSRDMSNPIASQETESGSLTIPSPGEGSYYWQVLLKNEDEILSRSPVSLFRIQENIGTPTPEFPLNGTTVNMSSRDSLPFRWSPVEKASGYLFTLYQIRDGKREKITEKLISEVSYVITDLSLLDVGKFAWSIGARGQSASGNALAGESVLSHFDIILSDLKAPEIVSPETHYIEKDLLKAEDLIPGSEE